MVIVLSRVVVVVIMVVIVASRVGNEGVRE